jgi:DNA replication and repair protein RecF
MVGSPSARRKFLDWGLFHVEHSYGEVIRSYQRLLKQRNALLKKLVRSSRSIGNQSIDTRSQIDYWDTQLSILGEQINDRRLSYVKQLNKEFSEVIRHFLPEFSFQISYYSGWDISLSLHSQLESKFEQDLKFGNTSSGVHKADLRIKTDGGVAAFEVLSRGQLRMLVAALQLSQTKILNRQGDNCGVFLLDDIGAELDDKHRQVFISSLMKTNTQVFITAIEKGQFSLTAETYNKKMFHVKHGHVIEEQ